MPKLDPTLSITTDLPRGNFEIKPSHIIQIQNGLSPRDIVREQIQSAQNRI